MIRGFVGKDQVTAPGDLNGDGRNDLTARNPATGALVLFLQRADGSFRHVGAGTRWKSYDRISAGGDLTGDGLPDLVARDPAGALWLYAGDGHAGFADAVRVPGRFGGYTTVTGGGDFTADRLGDLLVRQRSTGDTYVLPGRGDGTFGRRLGPVGGLTEAARPAVGNIGGNGRADVVALVGGSVRAWVNPGTFDLGRPIDTGVSFAGADRILSVGDWDRDGYADVVTRQSRSGNLVLWLGDGHGHLARTQVLATSFDTVARLAAVGDMTGDGYPDLLGQPRDGVMTIYPGRGLAGLKKAYPAYGAITAGSQIGIGRWNADGAPDTLIRKGARLTLYPGNGPGGLSRPSRLPVDLSPYDWVIGVSDLTRTKHPDLVVRAEGNRPALRPPGHDLGLPGPRLPRPGVRGLRPDGLTRVEARGDALVGRDPLASLLGRGGDQDHGTVASQRFDEGGETGRGSRTRLREEAAAVGDLTPGGGRSPQVRLGDSRDRPVVVGRGRPRDVRVGLRPHLDAQVVDAGGQGRRGTVPPTGAARSRAPGRGRPRRPTGRPRPARSPPRRPPRPTPPRARPPTWLPAPRGRASARAGPPAPGCRARSRARRPAARPPSRPSWRTS